MTHIWVVDRFEGRLAVLVADDDERQVHVPVAKLPAGTRAGAVLRVPHADGEPRWEAATVDEELRQARLREAEVTLDRLRRRDPGGDVAL
ncbi:MAG: DUF3006 domain-containing protein [Gemmatimonadetes bacterium]|nr:DUF3006 domain-containing protein [Gemmatimonadota bacterium]MYA64639.1 DUF3006 domain-containing protein [Gemmatimonadota bacterium]MYB99222.1 DUF3006 domain-containing protein [Gemmatimonadota bacterium]MYH52044.1 DUF3006 domain-containing protein [Gemmatimonadota bacterium]MYI46661.1 DUF3006 domain-containing protein [Gemmatimonadota bacterium]